MLLVFQARVFAFRIFTPLSSKSLRRVRTLMYGALLRQQAFWGACRLPTIIVLGIQQQVPAVNDGRIWERRVCRCTIQSVWRSKFRSFVVPKR